MSNSTAQALVERLDECRGTELVQERRRLVTTLEIVGQNRDTLQREYQRLKQDVQPDGRQAVPPAREQEFLRRFKNYLSSLYTLYKHGMRFRDKFLCSHETERGCCKQCDDENIRQLKRTDVLPAWGFVKKLRVHVDHYRLPLLHGYLTFVNDQIGRESIFRVRRDGEIVLNRSRYDNWAGETDNEDDGADELLDESEETEPVTVAINLYDSKSDYYEWLLQTVDERNEGALDEHEELVAELQTAVQ